MTKRLFLNCLLPLDMGQNFFGRRAIMGFFWFGKYWLLFFSIFYLFKLKLMPKVLYGHCHIMKQ
jgi:hypothetical protein